MRGTIGAALLAGIVTACSAPERDLWVVNTSAEPFALWVDGKEVAPVVAPTKVEDPRVVVHTKVKAGEHVIEARLPSGHRIERKITFTQKTLGWLFAPNGDASLCLYVVGADYGTSRGSAYAERLDLASTDVLELPHLLDRAFEPSPASIGVSQGSGAQDHALRMKPCGR